jgi:dTDP-4-dehydrorhamnose reductase
VSGTALVVGASGFLGRAVVRRLRADGWTVVGTYCSTPPAAVGDSRDGGAGGSDDGRHLPDETVQFDFWTDDLRTHVTDCDADAVVFAAAVEYGGEADTGETSAGPSFERAAERFVEACRDRRLVYVSSAAVFDGTQGRYTEDAERSPRDAYGRRLATVEDLVSERVDGSVILRTSYLFGVDRENLDRRLAFTREAVAAGESVCYFEDMYKSPVHVREAARAVRALVESDAGGVVHAPAPRISVCEFHREAMTALGYDASLVESEPMPDDPTLSPDRSLASNRFESLVGFRPSTVADAFDDGW